MGSSRSDRYRHLWWREGDGTSYRQSLLDRAAWNNALRKLCIHIDQAFLDRYLNLNDTEALDFLCEFRYVATHRIEFVCDRSVTTHDDKVRFRQLCQVLATTIPEEVILTIQSRNLVYATIVTQCFPMIHHLYFGYGFLVDESEPIYFLFPCSVDRIRKVQFYLTCPHDYESILTAMPYLERFAKHAELELWMVQFDQETPTHSHVHQNVMRQLRLLAPHVRIIQETTTGASSDSVSSEILYDRWQTTNKLRPLVVDKHLVIRGLNMWRLDLVLSMIAKVLAQGSVEELTLYLWDCEHRWEAFLEATEQVLAIFLSSILKCPKIRSLSLHLCRYTEIIDRALADLVQNPRCPLKTLIVESQSTLGEAQEATLLYGAMQRNFSMHHMELHRLDQGRVELVWNESMVQNVEKFLELNRCGRDYLCCDSTNQEAGFSVLERVKDDVNCLYLHLRENPNLLKRVVYHCG